MHTRAWEESLASELKLALELPPLIARIECLILDLACSCGKLEAKKTTPYTVRIYVLSGHL